MLIACRRGASSWRAAGPAQACHGKARALCANSQAGEAFNDDHRQVQQKPRRLPSKLVRQLSQIDDARARRSVAETVVATALSATAPLWLGWEPWVVLGSIVLTASRQQALFVLAHDAAHGRLFSSKAVNDAVGSACGTVVGISMRTYRVTHRLHHNHLYKDSVDPDIPIHGGYPRGATYLVRKLLIDLTGATAYKTYRYFFGLPLHAASPLDDTSPRLRRAAHADSRVVVATQLGAVGCAAASGCLTEYALLWLLPLATVFQQFLRLRSICEHGAVTDLSSPLTAARTNTGPAALLWLFMPHHVNHHIAHHVHPTIPHYNLPAATAEMQRHGLLDGAEVRDLRETLRLVFGASPT